MAKEISPKKKICDVSYQKILNDNLFITSKEIEFDKIISNLQKKNIENYNILIALDYKPTPGYELLIKKIIKKKSKIIIYYSEKKNKESTMLQVLTYPYCLLQIENLEKFKIKIKKKRLKFFPFSIFN